MTSRPRRRPQNGDYYADYGGYVAIGYDTTKVKVAPTSFKSLLNPIYKNQVAIDGNPAETGFRIRRGSTRRPWPTAARCPTSPPASPTSSS